MNDSLITIQEAAKMLGIRPVTLRKWDREGKLKAIRIGSRGDRRYSLEELSKFIKTSKNKIVWQEYIRNGLTYRFVSMVLDSMTYGIKEYFGIGLKYLMGYFEGNSLFWYYDNQDLHNLGEAIINKFANSKEFESNFFESSYTKSDEILTLVVNNPSEKIKLLKNSQIADIYEKYANLVFEDNSMSLSIDAIDEASMTDITVKVKGVLKAKLKKNYSEKEFSRSYNILIKPDKLFHLNNERLSTLYLTNDIQEKKITKDSGECKNRAQEIATEFWWTNLGWERGEAKTREDVLQVVNEILDSKLNIKKEIDKINNYKTETANEKMELNKEYNFSSDRELAFLLRLYDLFIPYHDKRKEVQMKTNFWEFRLLDEISQRTGISTNLLNWAEIKEIVALLKENKIDENELNQRSSNFLYLNIEGKVERISGKEAKKRHAQILGIELEETRDLQGVTASPGTAVGEAYVAISVANALKIKPGQILVTGMTTPDYVPAMRKAAAIVTDEGGMTCHAAIISREIGIPCIVGTKYGTRLIKTGDKIEVRANHGIVRKI